MTERERIIFSFNLNGSCPTTTHYPRMIERFYHMIESLINSWMCTQIEWLPRRGRSVLTNFHFNFLVYMKHKKHSKSLKNQTFYENLKENFEKVTPKPISSNNSTYTYHIPRNTCKVINWSSTDLDWTRERPFFFWHQNEEWYLSRKDVVNSPWKVVKWLSSDYVA